MSTEQVGRRALSGESGVRLSAIKRGRYVAGDVNSLVRGVTALRGLPVYVIDRPSLSPAQIRLETRRLQRRVKGGIGLVIVDHMQIMSAGEKVRDRVAELTLISKGLKASAKTLGLPVLALSQLNRAVKSRERPIPVISDLRKSGSIEQGAPMACSCSIDRTTT